MKEEEEKYNINYFISTFNNDIRSSNQIRFGQTKKKKTHQQNATNQNHLKQICVCVCPVLFHFQL